MTTVGIIDIGTNTILCLKASVIGSHPDIISDQKYHYRAGKRLDESGNISGEYKASLRQALGVAVSSIKDCDKIKIVATEVFRGPKDGFEFAHQLSKNLGYNIEIINHQREAELSYKGAKSAFSNLTGRIAVIDIGGGSTELAIGDEGGLLSWSGLKIGAVAVGEAVGYEAPFENYVSYADDTFRHSNFLDLLNPFPQKTLIVGGTGVAIASLLADIDKFCTARLQGWEISQPALKQLLVELAKMPLTKRQAIMSFDPQRADIIVSGGAIVLAFMRFAAIDTLTVSTRGLRYGLLEEIVRQFSA
jgi:exopolyphosphatase/guanosine-5'-triphosphate,3'-diphosphate pyrophosphatase